jgi:hypothetical protein
MLERSEKTIEYRLGNDEAVLQMFTFYMSGVRQRVSTRITVPSCANLPGHTPILDVPQRKQEQESMKLMPRN